MLYTTSVEALHLLRVTLDTPGDEGVERGGAAVQGGPGRRRRRADGDRGRPRVEGEPADGAHLAVAVRGGWPRGAGRPVAPARAVTEPAQRRAGSAGARAAAVAVVLGTPTTGPGARQAWRGAGALGIG